MTSSPPSAPSLARRLTRRAVDLLVIGFLGAVGLSVGQQLIEWWRVDPAAAGPDLTNLTGIDLDWNRTPITLRFGDASTSLERIPFQGDRKQLEEELTRIGQSIVTTVDNSSAAPIDEAERDWLKALQTASPVFWDSTRGNVYRRHEPLPSFVATRFAETDAVADQEAIPAAQRIVGWGLAFPSAPLQWTIYVFHPDSALPQQSVAESPIELPADSRNITNLRGSDGCQWRVIQGRGDIDGWVQHFDRQFGAKTCVSRQVDPQTANLKYHRERTMTDVQIRREYDGGLTAVIWSAQERESR